MSLPWLWLGGWSLGGEGFGPHDEREARRTVEYALYVGVRHFDTAGFYAGGRSEALLRKVLHGRRERVFLSSKGGLERDGRRVKHDARPEALRRALELSLKRLGTDYLDLFQLHWPDPAVPLAESIGALVDLQGQGLIRHWGAGNLDAQSVTACMAPRGMTPHQVHFNPVVPAFDVLEAGRSAQRCINCVVSPLEQGLLADGRALERLGKSDVRRRNPLFCDSRVLEWVAKFQRLSAASTVPRAAVVLLWILSQPAVDAVVVGARTLRQLSEVLSHRALLRALELGAPQGERAGWSEVLRGHFGASLWEHLGGFPEREGAGRGQNT